MNDANSLKLARLACGHFLNRPVGDIANYFKSIYGESDIQGICLDTIYVAEVDSGDFAKRTISSFPLRWWELSNAIYRKISKLKMSAFNTATLSGAKYWPHVVINFFFDNDKMLVIEKVSQGITLKRFCEVQSTETEFTALNEIWHEILRF